MNQASISSTAMAVTLPGVHEKDAVFDAKTDCVRVFLEAGADPTIPHDLGEWGLGCVWSIFCPPNVRPDHVSFRKYLVCRL